MKLNKSLKSFIIFILIIGILFLGYFLYYQFTKLNEEFFISSDFLYVFQSKNVFTLFNKLNESHILDAVFNNRGMKEIYKTLVDIKSQLCGAKQALLLLINSPPTFIINNDNGLCLIFNTGLKTPLFQASKLAIKNFFSGSSKVKISSEKYNGFMIFKLSMLSKRQNFYFTQIRNLLIFSMEPFQVKKCLDTFLVKKSIAENENFLQTKAQIGKNKLLTVFFNLTSILNDIKKTNLRLYENLKSLSILSIAGANLEINQESVKIISFYSTDIKDEQILKLFQSSPKSLKILNLLPLKTSSFITLTFDDFLDVWNYFNKILIKTGQQDKQKKLQETQKHIENLLNLSIKEQLFSWIDDEITINHVEGFTDPLVFIKIKDTNKIKKVFETFQKKNILDFSDVITYKNISVQQIKLSSFFEFFSSFISPDLPMPFSIFYDDYIILSKSKNEILFFIDSMKQDNNLLKQEKLDQLCSEVQKGNIISYWDLSKAKIELLKSKNLFSHIIEEYNFGMVSLEFADSGIKSTLIITEPRSGSIKIIDGWPISFNSPVRTAPLAYNIDNKNLDEIIIGTENGKVHLYDLFGERSANWPVKMASSLETSPFILHHPVKNDTFIGAVLSSGGIYLWNNKAFLSDNFPVSIEGNIENSPLVQDINNDKIADMIIANDKGRIYAVDINGKLLPGFPVNLDQKIKSRLALIDINNDKNPEILCSPLSPDGRIFFINNTGTLWDEKELKTGSLNFSDPVIADFKPGNQNIILITVDGRLFCWDMKANCINNFPVELNEKFVNPPAAEDINNDNKKEIILISAKGVLSVLDETGGLLFQALLNFKPVENEKIYIFDINKDGKKEIIIPGTDNFIRFYDAQGTLIFKIKGSTSPFIKDMDTDDKYEVLTASDDNNVYLYKLP